MIEVQSLSRYYGSRCAVDQVSFSIGANEVVGLLGLNGAGKTTILKVLAGLLLPSDGTVHVDGVDMATGPIDVRGRIGFLPEDPPLHLEMSVTDLLRFVGSLRGMSASDLDSRLPAVLQTTQLTEEADRVIGELSHGFRKRVGIATAIVHGPKLVILDEPISGLDPVQIVQMRHVIETLSTESTVLVSSHILSEISQTCNRILVLNNGCLVAQGTVQELAGRFHMAGAVDIHVSGELDAVRKTLEGEAGVKKVIRLSEGDGRVLVRVSMGTDVRESLVATLVTAGFGVRGIQDAHDELEEIFLDLTRVDGEGEA